MAGRQKILIFECFRKGLGGEIQGRGRRGGGTLDPPKAQKSKKINQKNKSQSQRTPLHARRKRGGGYLKQNQVKK